MHWAFESITGVENAGADTNGNAYEFTTKLLHLAWHPTENSIACAAANSLYMYYAWRWIGRNAWQVFGWPLVKGVALTQPARWRLHSSKPPASLCCRTYSLVSRRGCPIPRRSENLFCSQSGSLKSNSFQKKLHFFLMFRSRNVIVALSYNQNEGCSMPRWVCDWMQMRYFVHQSRCFLGCGACIADLFYSLWKSIMIF